MITARLSTERRGDDSARPGRVLPCTLFLFLLFAPLGKVLLGGSQLVQGIGDVLVGLLTLVYFVRWPLRSGMRALDYVLLLMAALSIAELANPNVVSVSTALPALRLYFLGPAWYLLGRVIGDWLPSGKQVRWMAALLVPLAIEALWALHQALFTLPVDSALQQDAASSQIVYVVASIGTHRLFGSLSGPFHLGLLASIGIPMSLMFGGKWRVPLVALFTSVLFLTYTRSMWLAAVAGILLLVLLRPVVERARTGRRYIRLALVLLAVAATIGAYFGESLPLPIDSSSALVSTAQYDLSLRVASWTAAILPTIADSPLGLGTGAASDQLAASPSTQLYFTSHNQLFQYLLEEGWLGGALYLAALALMLRSSRAVLLHGQNRRISLFGLSVMSMIVIGSVAAPVMETYPATVPFWLVMGMITTLAGHPRSLRVSPSRGQG